jgi:hypothetical protein
MLITLDIETCPAQNPAVREEIAATIEPPGNISKAETIAAWHAEKKPIAVEEAWRKTSFDGGLGHICVIGLAIDDFLPVAFYRDDWHASEAAVLREFFGSIDKACAKHPNERPVFIGHNLIEFDLRFIYQRAVVLGVKPSPHIPFNARPWGDSSVFDTMTAWAGARNRVSLDKLAKALGAGGKGDMDGSMVWDAVNEGRIAEVAEYCRDDVAMTRAIYKRMTFAPAPLTETCDIPF